MTGWISIHREIKSHWIWQDPKKFQWWIDILLTVNTEDNEVNIGNEIFICRRGEKLFSLQSWADRWRVSKDAARNFLKLLEKEKMITCVSIGKSTRLTVCKYDDYQHAVHVKKTVGKRSANGSPTQYNKENKENNKEDKSSFVELPASTATEGDALVKKMPTITQKEKEEAFIKLFNKITGGKYTKIDDKTSRQFKKLLKEGYTSNDFTVAIKSAIKILSETDKLKYLSPEYITRGDKFNFYLNSDTNITTKPRFQA